MSPRVSIGFPVRNAGELLRPALDALLGQSFRDFELIVSDNASTDGTPDVIDEYSRRDPRLRVFRQKENLGPAANFTFVLEQARGDYFMWAAHDDRWRADCVERWVGALDADPGAVLAFCNFVKHNLVTGQEHQRVVVPSEGDDPGERLRVRFAHWQPSMVYGLWRRSFLAAESPRLPAFDFSDLYLTHLAAVCGRILVVEEPLYISGVAQAVRVPYSLSGPSISYRTFFWRNVGLIVRRLPPTAWVPLLFRFVVFFLAIRKNTERDLREKTRAMPTA